MFGDALAEADWIIGNLFATLKSAGIDKNTLTVFAADNGPWMVKVCCCPGRAYLSLPRGIQPLSLATIATTIATIAIS